MCVCVVTDVFAFACVYMRVDAGTFDFHMGPAGRCVMCVCVFVCTCSCVYVCMCACVHVCVCMCKSVNVWEQMRCVCICVHMGAY